MKKKKPTNRNIEFIKGIVTDLGEATLDSLEAFVFSSGSAKILARNMGMNEAKYYSSMQSLKKSGYIKKINEDQFLITPKIMIRLAENEILASDWDPEKWDGSWRIVSFDIPEPKKRERNIFRSIIKRKGFLGIQNSVFIAPFADFKQLAKLRAHLDIEKYISFFIAKSAETDDDQLLKKRFGLK